jgi:type II secretory pathway pseudopilin PulG
MVEMLGVMAILSLIALALVPLLLTELDRVAQQQEVTGLRRLAEGLEKHVARHHVVPDQTTWAAAVSAAIGDSTERVLTNSRGQARRLIIDPTFGVGTNGTTRPPFTQSVLGSTAVTNPRYVILSSMGRPLPATLTSGFATTANAFEELWNLADGATPATWAWGGNGGDLRIQRVNLTPLFHQVTLNNSSALPALYSVNNSTPTTLPASPYTRYFLAGTVLGLHGVDATVQAKEVVTRSFSFAFEDGLWRGRLFAGLTTPGATTLTGADLEAAASSFLTAPKNPASAVTTDQVLAAMELYLVAYNSWAAAGFPVSGSTKTTVDTAQASLDVLVAGIVN